MRRIRQLLGEEAARDILNSATNGVLSLVDAAGMPYGVPVSYAYDGGGSVYFHSAVQGRKMECVGKGGPASFCVVGQDCIVPEEFTTYFRSVIASGRIHIVTDRDEMMKGLRLLCDKYSPGIDPEAEISKCIGHVAVLRLDIECMTGKESIELVRKRKDSNI